MRALPLLLPTTLVACFGPAGDGPDDGGQSGTAVPPHCVEDARAEVTDLSAVPDGFLASAADVLAAVEGTWTGSSVLADDAPIGVTWTVALGDGPVWAITSHLEEGLGSTGDAAGAPAEPAVDACPGRWALPLVTSLTADVHGLAADGEAVLVAAEPAMATFASATDLADVDGDLAPTAFDPADWDATTLTAEMSLGEDGAALSILWQASRATAEAATATGTVSTTTVEPSGMTEMVTAIAPLVRVE